MLLGTPETDIFMFGTPFIPLAKIHCFLETNKFLSKNSAKKFRIA